MKSRANIETAKPAAPAQSLAALRWAHNSHTVRGSHANTSSQTNGYEP